MDFHLPTPNSYLPTPNSYLPTPNSYLPTPNSHLPTPNSYLPTPNSHLPTPNSYLPSPTSYLPSANSFPTPFPRTATFSNPGAWLPCLPPLNEETLTPLSISPPPAVHPNRSCATAASSPSLAFANSSAWKASPSSRPKTPPDPWP